MNVLLFVIALSSICQTQWVETRSRDCQFKVSAPYQMLSKIDNIETDIGMVKSTVYYYNDQGTDPDNYIYMVTCLEYPEGTMHSDSTAFLRDFFDSSIEEAVTSVDGNLVYQSDYNYDAFPGRIWRISYNEDTAILRSVAYLVENRFYIVQTASLKSKSVNAAANRFTDSFRIL